MEHTCTTCGRIVKLVPNWNNYQAGRLIPESRVPRHARGERPTTARHIRQPICGGSGVVIPVSIPA